jgi:hypothetical protein
MSDLAELLGATRSAIVKRWLRRIKREHDPDDPSAAELRDYVPILFNELLSLTHRTEPSEAASTLIASRHGEQWLRAGFDVDEVVREFDLLGDTILEAAASADMVRRSSPTCSAARIGAVWASDSPS